MFIVFVYVCVYIYELYFRVMCVCVCVCRESLVLGREEHVGARVPLGGVDA